METTLGQQYNAGEKHTVILYTYINRHAGTPEKQQKQNRDNVVHHHTYTYYCIGCKYKATTWYLNGFPNNGSNLGSTVQCWGETHRYTVLLFLAFSVLVANNPKKLLYTVANPARDLLNREKRTKEKVWQHTLHPPPPTPHTARSEKVNKITRRIDRRYAGLGRSRVRTKGYLRLFD